MINNITEWFEIEKFIQSRCKKILSTPKKLIRGCFKEEGSEEIFEGDEFMAYPINRGSAIETYETYIDYFNYTSQDKFEKKRIAVNAEWVEDN